ncbi:LexA/Signal peptidase, partial [Fistulina hepatica ATCC 64428]
NVLCALHLFTQYVGRPSLTSGPSMLPTIGVSGEIVIESRLGYPFSEKRLFRGDLVTACKPMDPQRIVCKRILGLPGDVVCVDPTGEYAPSTEHIIIPQGHVWLAGDNAPYSIDSRSYGPVPIALIRGKLVARVCSLLLYVAGRLVLLFTLPGMAFQQSNNFQ